MRHPQTLTVLILVIGASFGLLMWAGALWAALGALVGGLVLAYVIALAWVRAPKTGAHTREASRDDSFSELR
ncbi:MAG: hypothetical protein ABUL60_22575 [Myxococcales bacterium]